MKYVKPVLFNSVTVNGAICGSGPSGRPCSKRS